jgi:hypothetical protein
MILRNHSNAASPHLARSAALPAFGLVVCSLVLASPSMAQETPTVTIESVHVEPSAPATDTLCKLTVTLVNGGDRTVSQLDFKVEINGQELPVYRNQLFMFPLAPGESTEVPLYNFWSTETSRPRPADDKLTIAVTLSAAQWMEISNDEDVEVWKPLGPVQGLPASKSLTLTMSK